MTRVTSPESKTSVKIWFIVIATIALLSGLSSVIFLFALQYVTEIRELNIWIFYLLPLAGISIAFLYKKYGKIAQKGNNLLLEEYYNPKGKIPWVMAPLIIVTTLITHLFGGSAGREGSAVQYGGTYGDKVSKLFKLTKQNNRIAILAGVAAGFASLFGTPLAGAIFAIEVFKIGQIRYKAFPIVLISAYLSHFICVSLQAPHSHYKQISISSYFSSQNLWIIPIGIICGIAARLFLFSGDVWSKIFKKIKNEYLRVSIGSILLILLVVVLQGEKYIGLGLSTISTSFQTPATSYDFLLKIIFTSLTLSIGFKGGEVTPLFFIGATLTSFLSIYIPLPLMLLAGLGFVGVFSGSTKTPLACSIMSAELFGWAIFPFALIVCLLATLISGKRGIYSSQRNFKKWF